MYTVHQAKTNLSKLLEEAEHGKDVIIARGKQPVAKLVALVTTRKQRTPGRYKGQINWTPGAFDPLTAKELKDWNIE
ncbi:MAG TPA: type II toxin-antitoxin system prevent-host-death family antitoxin [Terriglobales bacterium]|nr:type II toxin-antitoxin system prevent-host-death family antitoxin [Terriglobales bacterium]